MSSAVSLPNHTFTGQASSSKRLTSIVHILSPETDNCPSWINGREKMTVENVSWSISTKECCRPRWGLNPPPPGLQSDGTSNWATEAGSQSLCKVLIRLSWCAAGRVYAVRICPKDIYWSPPPTPPSPQPHPPTPSPKPTGFFLLIALLCLENSVR